MKKTLLILLALACLAVAKPLELDGSTAVSVQEMDQATHAVSAAGAFAIQPEPLAQQEFVYDDGDTTSYGGWSEHEIKVAKYFIGGDLGLTDCWITGFRMYYYHNGSGADVTCSFYDDSGGDPDAGTQLWTISDTLSHSSWQWVDYTLDTPVYDADATFYGIQEWDSTSEHGGVGADSSGMDNHDFQYFGSWSAGWYDYFIRAYVDDDTDAPYSANQAPSPGETGVPGDTEIDFDIVDDDAGTDGATIQVLVDSTDVTGDCTITDNGDGSFSVNYVPPSEYGAGDVVNVEWNADDLLTNSGSDSWTFTIQDDWNTVETSWGGIKNLE